MKKLSLIAVIGVLFLGLTAVGALGVEGYVDYWFSGNGSFGQQWNSAYEVDTGMYVNAFGGSANGRFYGEDWGDLGSDHQSNGISEVGSRIDADLIGPGVIDFYFNRISGSTARSHTRVEIFEPPVDVAMQPTAEMNTESRTTGDPYIHGPNLSELISDYNTDSGQSTWFPKRESSDPGPNPPAGGLISTTSGYDVEVDTQAYFVPYEECDPCAVEPNQGFFLMKELYNSQNERVFIRSQGGGWAGMLSEDSDAGDNELLLGYENANTRDPYSNGGGGAEFDATGWGSVEVGGSMGNLQFNTLGTINNQLPGTEGYIGFAWSGGSSFGLNDFTVHKDY